MYLSKSDTNGLEKGEESLVVKFPYFRVETNARVVLGAGKGVIWREMSSVLYTNGLYRRGMSHW